MASSSSSERWRQIEGLFYQALELKPEARPEFLKQSCGGDMELQNEVEGCCSRPKEQPISWQSRCSRRRSRW